MKYTPSIFWGRVILIFTICCEIFGCTSQVSKTNCNFQNRTWYATYQSRDNWDKEHIAFQDTTRFSTERPPDGMYNYIDWEFKDEDKMVIDQFHGSTMSDTIIEGDTIYGLNKFVSASQPAKYTLQHDTLKIDIEMGFVLFRILQCSDSSLVVLRIKES